MILTDPIVSPVVLAVAMVLLAGAVVFDMVYEPWRTRTGKIVNVVATVLIIVGLVGLNMRPYEPGSADNGEGTDAQFKDIDVMFVVDTTLSMQATDAQEGNRYRAMMADAEAIMNALPGCSAAAVSFDNQSKVLAPFTTDIVSVKDALSTATSPDYYFANGTDLSMPFANVKKVLERRSARDGRKMTLLFFMSDGENTTKSTGVAKAAASVAGYIDGGAVIGYGTPEGGKMPDGFSGAVFDYSTGQDAISRIDEDALKELASALGVEYYHDTVSGSAIKEAKAMWDIAPSYAGSAHTVANRTEYYFWFAIPLIIGLAGWLLSSSYEYARAKRAMTPTAESKAGA